jgi:hypothetical protein
LIFLRLFRIGWDVLLGLLRGGSDLGSGFGSLNSVTGSKSSTQSILSTTGCEPEITLATSSHFDHPELFKMDWDALLGLLRGGSDLGWEFRGLKSVTGSKSSTLSILPITGCEPQSTLATSSHFDHPEVIRMDWDALPGLLKWGSDLGWGFRGLHSVTGSKSSTLSILSITGCEPKITLATSSSNIIVPTFYCLTHLTSSLLIVLISLGLSSLWQSLILIAINLEATASTS